MRLLVIIFLLLIALSLIILNWYIVLIMTNILHSNVGRNDPLQFHQCMYVVQALNRRPRYLIEDRTLQRMRFELRIVISALYDWAVSDFEYLIIMHDGYVSMQVPRHVPIAYQSYTPYLRITISFGQWTRGLLLKINNLYRIQVNIKGVVHNVVWFTVNDLCYSCSVM